MTLARKEKNTAHVKTLHPNHKHGLDILLFEIKRQFR